MDLHAVLAGPIEEALARMAPGERVAWAISPVNAQDPTNGNTATFLRLTLFTPSPVLGQAINWSYVTGNPFELVSDDHAAIDLVISTGLEALRQFAATQLTKGS